MSEYKRILLLILIMAEVAVVVGATAIGVLYQTAFEQQRYRLMDVAQNQARLLEAMARFDEIHADYPGGPREAALAQIRDAHEHIHRRSLGRTGEYTLARLEEDTVVYLLRHQHSELEAPTTVPFHSHLGEPMRRALSGLSGAMVGLATVTDTPSWQPTSPWPPSAWALSPRWIWTRFAPRSSGREGSSSASPCW